jgi:PKD repeat protein
VKTVSNVVNVIEPAISNYTYTINGNVVSFTFTGSGAQSYFWTFGDGTSSFSQNPVHTYQNDGLFTVSLTVTNDCGTAIENKTLNIITVPTANFSASSVLGCQELTVNFTNTSSNNSQTYLWTFPGGNPSTSTLFSPTVVYPNDGVFDVSLKVTNTQGTNTKLKQNYINVLPLPIPYYSVVVNQNTAQFTNNSQYQISAFWEFGDGTTSTQLNPTHSYTNNGNYNVVLHSINNCDTISLTQTVTIALPPVASFTPSTITNVCAGETVNFQSTSGFSPTSYNWVFQGGNPSTSNVANPIVSYPNGGNFDVSLIVTNANGSDTLVQSSHVLVNTAPIVSFTHVDDDLTISFTSSVNNGTGLIWNFGDGNTSTQQNPIHTYTVGGTYMVSLTAENECGPSSNTQTIIAQLQPIAGFTSSQTSGCNPTSISFMSMSSNSVVSWAWAFEGGNPASSTLRNPVVSYTSPGTFNVSLIVTNVVGQDTLTINDYINIITVPTASFIKSIASNIITLTNTGIGATTTTWGISRPDGSLEVLTGTLVNYTAPSNGDYSIIQTNINDCGVTVSNVQIANVNAYPIVNFSIDNGAGACEDSETIFIDLSSNGTSSLWLFEGGAPSTSTASNPKVVYSNPGNYIVKLISTNSLGTDTLSSTISIGEKPKSGFSEILASGNVSFTFSGSATSSFLWMFGDGSTSTLQNPSHTYPISGSFVVKQISINACGQDTTTKTIAIIGTSVYDSNLKRSVTVSPNPNNGRFNIVINDSYGETYQISMFDVLGNKLYSTLLTGYGNEINHPIDISHLPSASYFVRITTDKASLIKKVIIQK